MYCKRKNWMWFLVLLITIAGYSWSATIYVDIDATGSDDGTSWADAYDTIQEGINGAATSDTVIVAEGTYTETIDFSGKAITVCSTDPNDWDVVGGTTIDGNASGSVVIFNSSETSSSILEGFTIKNGDATNGGGIYCNGASPTIRKCVITDNSASTFGGGIYVVTGSDPDISNCIINANDANCGGGFCANGSDATISSCLLYDNTANIYGGAIYSADVDLDLTNCTIIDNSASTNGSGICLNDADTTATVTNCILWSNGTDAGIMINGATLTISYSCIEGGYSGTGNIDSYPFFEDYENNDYHLTWNSPCIDKGDPAGSYTGQIDIDSDERELGDVVDMGADEFSPPYVNLVQNPGFEEGLGGEQGTSFTYDEDTPVHWVDYWTDGSRALDSTDKHSGSYSWKIMFDNETQYPLVLSDKIYVDPNQAYCLSAWIKTSDSPQSIQLGWNEYKQNDTKQADTSEKYFVLNKKAHTEWAKYQNTASPYYSDTAYIRLRLLAPKSGIGSVGLDDFSLVEHRSDFIPPYGCSNKSGVVKSVNFGEDTNISWTNYSTEMDDPCIFTNDENIEYRELLASKELTIKIPDFNTDPNGFPETPMLLEIMYQDTYSYDSSTFSNNVHIYSRLKYDNLDPNYTDEGVAEEFDHYLMTLGGDNDSKWKYAHYACGVNQYQLLRAFDTDDDEDEEFLIKIQTPSGVTLPIDYISMRAISQDEYDAVLEKQRDVQGASELSLPEDEPASPPTYSDLTVFTRDIMRPVYSFTKPQSDEIDADITGFTAWGVVEPVSFAIYSENGIEGLSVSVSNLVHEEDPNDVILSNNISIYNVVYDLKRLKPEYQNLTTSMFGNGYASLPDRLESFDTLDIEADTSQRIWMKISIPKSSDGLSAGLYEGTVTLSKDGMADKTIDIEFTVLDITLDAPEHSNPVYLDPVYKIYSQNMNTILDAYAETGLEPFLFFPGAAAYPDHYYIEVSKDVGEPNDLYIDPNNFEYMLGKYINVGYAQDVVIVDLRKNVQDVYSAIVGGSIWGVNLYYNLSNTSFKNAFGSLLDEYDRIADENNLTFMFTGPDEPRSNIAYRIWYERVSKLVHDQYPDGKMVSTYSSSEELPVNPGSYNTPSDYNGEGDNSVPPMTDFTDIKLWVASCIDSGYDKHHDPCDPNYFGEFGYYTTFLSSNRNPVYNRLLHGLYPFSTDAAMVAAYAMGDYARLSGASSVTSSDPYNDFDGSVSDYLFVYPTWEGGLLYTIGGLEGIREGIKDAKYIATLKNLIAEDPDAPVAIVAQDYLDDLKTSVGTSYKSDYIDQTTPTGYQPAILETISEYDDPNDYEAFTRIREQIADYIVLLDSGNNYCVHNLDQDEWFTTVQDAIDNATTDDVILVYPGTYNEQIDFIGKAITVQSTDPNDWDVVEATIIDGGGDPNDPCTYGPVVTFDSGEDSSSILGGFTITGGYNDTDGGGIYCLNANPTIRWCAITGNYSESSGGGIAVRGENLYADLDLNHCKVYDNESESKGGGLYHDCFEISVTAENCLLYENTAPYGGAFASDSCDKKLFVRNCTVTDNTCSVSGAGLYMNGTRVRIENSIFWSNGADAGIVESGILKVYFSDIHGGFSGTGSDNINSDPNFVSDDDFYHLNSGSPCIDVGDNSVVDWNYDLDLDNRIINGGTSATVDMGSDEYDPGS